MMRLNLHPRNSKRIRKKHSEAVMILFAMTILLSISLFFIGEISEETLPITGAVISIPERIEVIEDSGPIKIQPVEEKELFVGEPFVFIVKTNKNSAKFQDNTDLFNINDQGTIRFTPLEKDIGRKKVVIVAEDNEGNFDSIMIIMNIKNE